MIYKTTARFDAFKIGFNLDQRSIINLLVLNVVLKKTNKKRQYRAEKR